MLRIVSQTDTGVMRQQNQDCAKSGALADGTIWSVVCDGMGGAVGGAIANWWSTPSSSRWTRGSTSCPAGRSKTF